MEKGAESSKDSSDSSGEVDIASVLTLDEAIMAARIPRAKSKQQIWKENRARKRGNKWVNDPVKVEEKFRVHQKKFEEEERSRMTRELHQAAKEKLNKNSEKNGEDSTNLTQTNNCDGDTSLTKRSEKAFITEMSVNIVYTTKHEPYSTPEELNTIQEILLNVEKGDSEMTGKCMTESPVKAKAGDVIVYKRKSPKDAAYMSDQYSGFRSKGNNKASGRSMMKKYYQMLNPESINTELGAKFVEFRKHIYTCPSSQAVLIHYLGDESLWKPSPHGNSKTGRPYIRTSSTTMENIKAAVQQQHAKPKLLYHGLVKDALKTDTKIHEAEVTAREPVKAPRDEKQIRNCKESLTRQKKLLRCEIFSLYEMAKQDLGKFILRQSLIPYDVVVVADPSILKLTSDILKECVRNKELRQLLTYDTTFECTNSYVSVLVMKNTYLCGDPIFPVAFMIHDRKVTEVHEEFWRAISKVVDFEPICGDIPICTDREPAITAGLLAVHPSASLVYCNNHIKRDVRTWIKSTSEKSSDDVSILSSQVAMLLEADTSEEFDMLYDSCKEKWSEDFAEYIECSVMPDMKSRAARFVVDKFKVFEDQAPTNNIGESMNFIVKHMTDWTELPADALVLHFVVLQCEFLLEFSRATRSLGKYVLKPQYKHIQLIVPTYATFSTDDFIRHFKPFVQESKDCIEKTTPYLRTKEALAEECRKRSLVTHVPAQHLFVVRSIFSDSVYTVQKQVSKGGNGAYTCSCNSPSYCYHKLAVLNSLQDTVPLDSHKYQLSILKKKSRGHNKKVGTKRPNPTDLIDMIKEAPDSQMAKRKMVIHSHVKNPGDYEDPLLHFETNIARSLLLQNTPSHIPDQNHLLQLPMFESIGKGKWLTADVVDSVIMQLLNGRHESSQIKTQILYFENLLYQSVTKDFNQLLNFSAREHALNKDVILVSVLEGSHFMLGVILFKPREIILLDPMAFKTKSTDRAIVFQKLSKIAAVITITEQLRYTQTDWSYIYANDLASQLDETECGPIACLNAYSIIGGDLYPNDIVIQDAARNRRWILNMILIAQSKKFCPPVSQSRTIIARRNDLVQALLSIVFTTPVIKTEESYGRIVRQITVQDKGWTICGHSQCLADNEHDQEQYMCVQCRVWFHQSCTPSEPIPEFFICPHCCSHRLFSSTTTVQSSEMKGCSSPSEAVSVEELYDVDG